MEFHQSAAERFAESIFKFVIREFDGKSIGSDECNLEAFMKKLPKDIDDDICLEDHIPAENQKVEVSNESSDEVFQDTINSPSPKKEKKPKKAKKEKKSKSDTDEDKPKKKRPENAYFYFKRQPEIQEKINDYAEENSVTDKRKAAKGVWDELSQDEKDEWKQKAIDEFNKNNDE